MNPYSLPSFIGAALLIVFGLSVILMNPHDKTSRLLCLLCLYLSFLSVTVGMLHQSNSEAEANFWNKWPYVLTLSSYFIMIEYAYQISGGIQRQSDTIVGLSIKVHRLILYILIFSWITILIFTDLIIAPAKYYSTTGWEHQYGPLYPFLVLTGATYAVGLMIFIFLKGIKSVTNRIEKRSIVIAFIALVFLQIFIYIPGVILPYIFDLQTHSFSPFGFVLMCFFLTYGLMKTQREKIQDLNINLEKKIASRTEELTETNKKLQYAKDQISKYIDPNVADKIFKGVFSTQLSLLNIH